MDDSPGKLVPGATNSIAVGEEDGEEVIKQIGEGMVTAFDANAATLGVNLTLRRLPDMLSIPLFAIIVERSRVYRIQTQARYEREYHGIKVMRSCSPNRLVFSCVG